MRKWFGWMFLISFFFSCSKGLQPSSFALDGGYSGVYLQTGAVRDTVEVTIAFAGSGFSGETNNIYLPICNGNYNVFSDSINFTNLCAVPDSSLILFGKYKMTTVGDSLYFTRSPVGADSTGVYFNLKHL